MSASVCKYMSNYQHALPRALKKKLIAWSKQTIKASRQRTPPPLWLIYSCHRPSRLSKKASITYKVSWAVNGYTLTSSRIYTESLSSPFQITRLRIISSDLARRKRGHRSVRRENHNTFEASGVASLFSIRAIKLWSPMLLYHPVLIKLGNWLRSGFYRRFGC